jgi:hypothetical protein
MSRAIYKNFLALVAIAGLASALAVHAQEFAYENMTGGVTRQPASAASPVLAYGASPQIQFPPKIPLTSRRAEGTGTAAYCVRTCDGRYFPAPSADHESRAQGCRNLCPASETSVFYGESIDGASTREGKLYSALPNAFRYRKELVKGCSCNGKDVIGLARIGIDDDKTLRRGDLVATAAGLELVSSVSDGQARFAALPRSQQIRFARPPVVASE